MEGNVPNKKVNSVLEICCLNLGKRNFKKINVQKKKLYRQVNGYGIHLLFSFK